MSPAQKVSNSTASSIPLCTWWCWILVFLALGCVEVNAQVSGVGGVAHTFRGKRTVVQSCAPHAHTDDSTGSEVLHGRKFVSRVVKKHGDSFLRYKAQRLTSVEGCIVGSFEEHETVKIMLLADGYTDDERLLALNHIKTVAEALTEREPFKRYHRFLSICYKVQSTSTSGVSSLGTQPNCGGVDRALCTDPNLVKGAAIYQGVKPNVTAVLFNSNEYFGASQYWDGIFSISRASTAGVYGKPQHYWLAMHEFLHTCCTSPSTPIVRDFAHNKVSRFDFKIQDEYPTGQYQCGGTRSYNLSSAIASAPWSYLSGVEFIPMNLDGKFCAYKPTQSSIMATLQSPLVNLPTQAGWIRQLFATIHTVHGVKVLPAKEGLRKGGVMALGAERLPYPVIDWIVNGHELPACRNKVVCELRRLGLVPGTNSVRVRVGVADPSIDPAELPDLTDEVSAELFVGGRLAIKKVTQGNLNLVRRQSQA